VNPSTKTASVIARRAEPDDTPWHRLQGPVQVCAARQCRCDGKILENRCLVDHNRTDFIPSGNTRFFFDVEDLAATHPVERFLE
jgi:hypothetical protein